MDETDISSSLVHFISVSPPLLPDPHPGEWFSGQNAREQS